MISQSNLNSCAEPVLFFKLRSIIVGNALSQAAVNSSFEALLTVVILRLLKCCMNLSKSVECLKLPNFKAIHEVDCHWLVEVLVFDLSLEDLDIYSAICLLEVVLQDVVGNLKFLLVLHVDGFCNVASCMNSVFVYRIPGSEELEDVLAVEWVSGGKIMGKGVLSGILYTKT